MYYEIKAAPVMTRIREGRSFVRTVSLFVLMAFVFVSYSPALLAAVDTKMPEKSKMTRENYDAERNFEQLETLLTDLNANLSKADSTTVDVGSLRPWSGVTSSISGDVIDQDRLKLRAVWQKVEATQRVKLDQAVAAMEKLEKKIPQKKIEQRRQKLAEARHHIDSMDEYMEGIDNADSISNLKRNTYSALKHLLDTRPKPPTHVFDSNQMPFGVDSDATRAPYATSEQLHSYLGLPVDPDFDPAREGVNLFTDLRPTTDVQITDDIRALAEQLNRSPTAIYNWVYNNIHYIPSFGSIQGSDLTLANRQGNAFDIASLLIALLRASNVPARYVYGTVIVDADKMKNWVGGVDDVESARVLLGQGGIPGSAISNGGRFESIRFEHVWVEAYGIFNDEHRLRWNAMDAAFKQYRYTEGVDFLSEIGFDKQGFSNLVKNAGQSDATNNWVANVDASAIQAEMSRYQEALTHYLQNQPADTTLSELIGGQSIITRDEMEPPGALPYQSYVRTRSFATLPDKLRHYFYVDLAPAMDGRGLGAVLGGRPEPFMSYRASLPDLAGKKLSLSFRPASEADEVTLQALLGSVGSQTDFPRSIEAGLFDLIAEISVDGELVASSQGKVVEFGDQLITNKGFVDPRFGYRETSSTITAGCYQAIGLDFQGMTAKQLKSHLHALQNIQSAILGGSLAGITAHDAVGSLLHSGMAAYFSVNDFFVRLISKTNGLVSYRMPSFGTFSTYGSLDPAWGGFGVHVDSVVMDVDWLMINNEGRNNCWGAWVTFNQMVGQLASSFEHIIPEKMFSDGGGQNEAVSTIKALSVANSQGQRIYRITSENVGVVNSLVEASGSVKNDIRSAISTGKIVLVHERPIDYKGFVGTGYIVLDPETGGGAYKITGGGNGAFMVTLLGLAILFIFGMYITSGAAAVAGFVLLNAMIYTTIACIGAIAAAIVYAAMSTSCPVGMGGYAGGGVWAGNLLRAISSLGMTIAGLVADPTKLSLIAALGIVISHADEVLQLFNDPVPTCEVQQ